MLKPISLQLRGLRVHPFGADDFLRYDELVADIFSILSDERTLKYLPAKRLDDLQSAEAFLQNIILNYHAGRNYLHFITDNDSARVIGMIDLISPGFAKEHYDFDRYPHFIEFYLGSGVSGCNIMTELLPQVVDFLLSQGLSRLGAVVHRDNVAARKVLQKSRFTYHNSFDPAQDYFEVSL